MILPLSCHCYHYAAAIDCRRHACRFIWLDFRHFFFRHEYAMPNTLIAAAMLLRYFAITLFSRRHFDIYADIIVVDDAIFSLRAIFDFAMPPPLPVIDAAFDVSPLFSLSYAFFR